MERVQDVGATRLRGNIEQPLKIPKPTDLILVQSWGEGTSKVRDISGREVLLTRGSSIHVTGDVVIVVPGGATIDLVYISGSD